MEMKKIKLKTGNAASGAVPTGPGIYVMPQVRRT
jgi:hypothetical protein